MNVGKWFSTGALFVAICCSVSQVNAGENLPQSAMTGRILTPDGAPINGAQISWFGTRQAEDENSILLQTVHSDAEGRFFIAGLKNLLTKYDERGILVEAPGWGATSVSLTDLGVRPLDVKMRPATALKLSFRDENGQPIENLRVRFRSIVKRSAGRGDSFPFSFVQLPEEEKWTVRTGANGTCTYNGFALGDQVNITLKDERYANLGYDKAQIKLDDNPLTQPEPITLIKPASIRGRVAFGPSGKPIAGLKIFASSDFAGHGEAITQANGEFNIGGLLPGTYRLGISKLGLLEKEWAARQLRNITLGKGETLTGKNLNLVHGAIVKGRVLAIGSNEPVVNQSVSVNETAWSQTDKSGNFQMRVPGGSYQLYLASDPPPGFGKALTPTVTSTGRTLPRYRRFSNDSYEFSIKDGETLNVDFRLPKTAPVRPIKGQVFGEDGTPVANATVWVERTTPFDTTYPLPTDSQGRFEISAQEAARPVHLRASKDQSGTAQSLLATGGDQIKLHLKDNAFASLTALVTDSNGKPLAGAKVGLVTWTGDSGSGDEATKTDATGHFVIPDLWPDGNYSLNVTQKGYGEAQTHGHIQLKPGEVHVLHTFVLQKADSFLAGRVVDGKGNVMPGVHVNVMGWKTKQQHLIADKTGRFRFDEVVAGEKVRLSAATADSKQYVEKEVGAGHDDIVLVLHEDPLSKAPEAKSVGSKAGASRKSTQENGITERYERFVGKAASPLNAVAWINAPQKSSLQMWRGRIILVEFWGTGCGPCVAAMPEVQKIWRDFNKKGVTVVGLHSWGTPVAEMRKDVAKFVAARGITYPIAIDARDEGTFGKTFRRYTVEGIPTYAVIDREGKVAYLDHSLQKATEVIGDLLALPAPSNAYKARAIRRNKKIVRALP